MIRIVRDLRFLIDQTTRFISPITVAAEWVIVVAAAVLVALTPFPSRPQAGSLRRAFHWLASQKHGAIALCGLLPVVLRLAMLGVAPVPDPSIHDEFSHLLLGDTLAQGRLSNPTHPMWQHFESIHIIQQPTYSSMYPPAQGSFLALGQVMFREPWVGVLLSVGLLFAALCWMMRGWLPPAWALFGTLIAILKIGIFGFWINSYLGGAVPAIGGALLVGSLPRLTRKGPRTLYAILFAIGLVVLMNSRPFEGAVLGAASLLYLSLVAMRRSGSMARPSDMARWLKSFLLPVSAILACGILFTGVYCWKVTGNPLRMPYQVNRDTYGWPENLAILPAKTVSLRHKALQDMHTLEVSHRNIYRSPQSFLENITQRLFDNWTFFLGPVLTVPLLFLPWLFRSRRMRPLLGFTGLLVSLNSLQMVLYPYHLAPIVPVLFLLLAQAIRHMYVGLSQIDRRKAVCFALMLPLCLVVVGTLKQHADTLQLPLAYWEHAAEPHGTARMDIATWLSARPRQQLVVVRYASHHSPNQEWVYNAADIDNSKVVWAREMDAAANRRLLQYFANREAWLLEADQYPPHVVKYDLSLQSKNSSQSGAASQ